MIGPGDPGVRGTIDISLDRIVFREDPLSRAKIDAYSPFDQASSDTGGQPIHVVITPDAKTYVMQGNHRIYSSQEQNLRIVSGIIYTAEEWEEFTGSSFVIRGTNNPMIN